MPSQLMGPGSLLVPPKYSIKSSVLLASCCVLGVEMIGMAECRDDQLSALR